MKVFISYSERDEPLAKKVAAALEEAGLDTWHYKREIMPGDNWAEKVAQGLKEADAMVVLLTPAALESAFVRWNIDYALTEKAFNKRLIPVFVGKPEEFSQHEIPWILKRLKTITLPKHGKNEEQLRQIAQALKEVA